MAKDRSNVLKGDVRLGRLRKSGRAYRIIRNGKQLLGTFVHTGRATPDPWEMHYETFVSGKEVLFAPVFIRTDYQDPIWHLRKANKTIIDMNSSFGPRSANSYIPEFSRAARKAIRGVKTLMEAAAK